MLVDGTQTKISSSHHTDVCSSDRSDVCIDGTMILRLHPLITTVQTQSPKAQGGSDVSGIFWLHGYRQEVETGHHLDMQSMYSFTCPRVTTGLYRAEGT